MGISTEFSPNMFLCGMGNHVSCLDWMKRMFHHLPLFILSTLLIPQKNLNFTIISHTKATNNTFKYEMKSNINNKIQVNFCKIDQILVNFCNGWYNLAVVATLYPKVVKLMSTSNDTFWMFHSKSSTGSWKMLLKGWVDFKQKWQSFSKEW